ncbi:463de832-8e71-49e2-85c2-a80e9807fecb-CDS [Sclerotinia trifoliorum]|uniref:463de832-8e71-49e2-85c2-a80e9807fecb-CDS n=1 Tax=Sclerotinia trifoliorum TaxID=28548 RepID=A0A8H2VVH5_9HELO|nr:463de832-8e71-49e2-85c2-a80e9807fecb-CDS [Sclerotinia trifoliorum]
MNLQCSVYGVRLSSECWRMDGTVTFFVSSTGLSSYNSQNPKDEPNQRIISTLTSVLSSVPFTLQLDLSITSTEIIAPQTPKSLSKHLLMCYRNMVSPHRITPILPEGIIMNDPTNLGKFDSPVADAQTIMTCCKCSQTTPLDTSAPGSTSCCACSHYECNDCDYS